MLLPLYLLLSCIRFCLASASAEHQEDSKSELEQVKMILATPCENQYNRVHRLASIICETTSPDVLSFCLGTARYESAIPRILSEKNYLSDLVNSGRVDLLEVCLAHRLITNDTFLLAKIENVAVLKFLYQNQLITGDSRAFALLNIMSVQDLDFLLQNGLPIEARNFGRSLLEEALDYRRVDLAADLHLRGLKLEIDTRYKKTSTRLRELAMRLAKLAIAPQLLVLLAARHAQGGSVQHVPTEVLVGHIGQMLVLLTFPDVLNSLLPPVSLAVEDIDVSENSYSETDSESNE